MIMVSLNKKRGLSLIEILISLLLGSLILFGFEAGQIYAIHEAKTAWFLTTAINQINNLTERLMASQTDEGLTELIDTWNSENSNVLPSGFGTVSGAWPDYNVTIYWGARSDHCEKQVTGSSGCLKEKIQLE